MSRTKGQLEAAVSQTVIRFKREITGRGPLDARTYLLDDVVLVRLRGVLTVAEQRLAASPQRGGQLIRLAWLELLEQSRPLLEQAISEVLGVAVRSVYSDLDVVADERVIVFSLASRPLAIAPAERRRGGNRAETGLTAAGQSHMITGRDGGAEGACAPATC